MSTTETEITPPPFHPGGPAVSVSAKVNLPAKYIAARNALAECLRVDEVKTMLNKAIALEVYALQQKDPDLISASVYIQRRAVRRIGELMTGLPKAKGTRGQLAGKTKGTGKGRGKAKAKVSGAVPKTAPETDAKTLKDLGIDENLAKRARAAAATSEEKYEAATNKTIKIAVAAATDDKAVVTAARAERQAEKKNARAEREIKVAAKIQALPDRKYGVVVADPQWGRTVYSAETGMDRHAANHYPTATTGDEATQDNAIKALDVGSIAARDCVLGLWCTDPHRGIDVMRAWDFKPVSYFVWVKDIVEIDEAQRAMLGVTGPSRLFQAVGAAGTGFWNRDRDELMLIGVRGHPVCPALGTQGESVWFARRGEHATSRADSHSDKPDCAQKWFERHWPHTPKIELNARRRRAGWDAWGPETPTAEAQREAMSAAVAEDDAPPF